MMKYAMPQKFAIAGLVLLAGSCSAPQRGSFFDPMENHPISVQETYARAQFIAPDPAAQMPPNEAARFGSFVADYLERGHGSLLISVPKSAHSAGVISYFGQKLESLGIPEEKIQVGTHDTGKGTKVWLQYTTYQAKADSCGDWSDNVTHTFMNTPTKNFGCATQYNLAAQVDNPADLVTPRKSEGASGARRADVIQKYEKGNSTASKGDKSSVKISDVGDSGSGS